MDQIFRFHGIVFDTKLCYIYDTAATTTTIKCFLSDVEAVNKNYLLTSIKRVSSDKFHTYTQRTFDLQLLHEPLSVKKYHLVPKEPLDVIVRFGKDGEPNMVINVQDNTTILGVYDTGAYILREDVFDKVQEYIDTPCVYLVEGDDNYEMFTDLVTASENCTDYIVPYDSKDKYTELPVRLIKITTVPLRETDSYWSVVILTGTHNVGKSYLASKMTQYLVYHTVMNEQLPDDLRKYACVVIGSHSIVTPEEIAQRCGDYNVYVCTLSFY